MRQTHMTRRYPFVLLTNFTETVLYFPFAAMARMCCLIGRRVQKFAQLLTLCFVRDQSFNICWPESLVRVKIECFE